MLTAFWVEVSQNVNIPWTSSTHWLMDEQTQTELLNAAGKQFEFALNIQPVHASNESSILYNMHMFCMNCSVYHWASYATASMQSSGAGQFRNTMQVCSTCNLCALDALHNQCQYRIENSCTFHFSCFSRLYMQHFLFLILLANWIKLPRHQSSAWCPGAAVPISGLY